MFKAQSIEKCLQYIKSGHRVFVHGAAATPQVLLESLTNNCKNLKDVEVIHLHTEGEAKYAREECSENFRVVSLFTGLNIRKELNYDRVDYLPCFLSEISQIFRTGARPIDVALVHLSPPDKHGFCTFGSSVDVVRAAVDSAKFVIAQINAQMPRVHGDGFIHINEIDAYIEVDEPLPSPIAHTITPDEANVGSNVASLIEDGACLQVGIGTIPDAVLASLYHHKDLGIHSEMWSDGVLNLIKRGVVNNSLKSVHANKTVSSFIVGSKEVYEFIDDNPAVIQLAADYVNNPNIISRNKKVMAINSAVEVDLTGQVCADSVGHNIISGVGGQMDFMRGAALSEKGKPIIAMLSRSRKGKAKIVAELKPGAGVVTTRSHVHYVVTEFGVVNLFGKTLNERARSLIALAHPDDREQLEKNWISYQRQNGSL